MFTFIIIFVLKLIEVVISTHQISAIAKCKRNRATFLGAVSCVLWLLAIRATVFDGVWGFAAYCMAYTLGTYFGMWSIRK